MASSKEIAEEVYFLIYEQMAAKSDYLQPDSHRQMLPEAVIVAGVAAILTGIWNGVSQGFLSKIGENLADRTSGLVKELKLSAKPQDLKPEQAVEAIHATLPALQGQAMNWDVVAASVSLELTRAGVPLVKSQEIAAQIVMGMRNKIGGAA